MTQDMEAYNTAVVRKLLQAAFTADELRRFCQDRPIFGPVLVDVPARASLNEMADVLIQYCETNHLLDDLCAAVKEVNPRQYERFEPDLHSPFEPPARPSGLCLGAPMQAPPLPPHFIPRPEVSEILKARLLAEADTAPGVLVVSAIQGLGGIGKSVLAAALAHDPDVQARFPDGILWVMLGQQPELHSLLSDWIVNGLRDYNYRPTTVETASTHLRTLFLDKAALLVVDDVWDPEHARPFLVGSPRCRVLITTRRADVADEVGADLHQMDIMTQAQSLALLAARLGRQLEEEEYKDALRLARLVGHLPLALELAAARVARGATWTGLCAALEEEVARLEALDSARRRRKRATRLEASFNLSLNALRADDGEAWEAFAWLGVLPEDVTITAPMAATLWNVDRAEAGDLLELLWNDALLLLGSPVRIGEEEMPGYRLHDLLHDLARGLLTGDLPYGLEWSLEDGHATLLERYRVRTQDGLWHTLTNDGYIHSHLTWHMEQAGRVAEIHALLAEETDKGHNGWSEARERLGQTAGYLADVSHAWRLAEEQDADAQARPAGEPHRRRPVGLQCRYALILASLNSLAGNIPAELMLTLVSLGRWTPAQALSYARQVPKLRERVEVLAALASQLPRGLKEEALIGGQAAALALEDDKERAEALAALAPKLTKGLRDEVLVEALAAAQTIRDEERRAEALAGLAPQLTGELLVEGLTVARTIRDDWCRAHALAALAPQLMEGQREEVLDAARAIEDEASRAHALTALAPQLMGPQREETLVEALVAARAIDDGAWRAKLLATLAPQLTGAQREEVLGEALAVARTIEDGESRVRALAALAPQLTEVRRDEVLVEAVAAARAISPEWSRARALALLAPQLTGKLLVEALAATQAIWDIMEEGARAHALVALAPQLTGELLMEGLAAAQATQYAASRAHALAALASQLPEAQQKAALSEALTATRAASCGQSRARALAALTPHLTEELVTEALAAARAIEDEGSRVHALAALAPHLMGRQQEEALSEALTAARAALHEGALGRALVALAPHLTGKLLVEGLAAAQAILHRQARAEALVALAPRLEEELLMEGLAAARAIVDYGYGNTIEDEEACTRALTALASQLRGTQREEVLAEALAAARAIRRGWMRPEALAALALQFTGVQRKKVLREALAAARAIRDGRLRAHALAALAPQLTGEGRKEALVEGLAAARAIGDKWARAHALAALAPQLTGEGRKEALVEGLAAARAIGDKWACSEALAVLTPHLVGELSIEALAVARAIEDKAYRAVALVALAPQLTGAQREEALVDGLAAARAIRNSRKRAEILAELAPQLAAEQREEVLGEALAAVRAIEDKEVRRPILMALAPQLETLSFPTLYALWRENLHHLAVRTRRDLLSDLGALLPVIVVLGGHEAVTATWRAIQDAGLWWP
ncbi:MAG: hypothetical protein JXA14_03295 [Anaerolineae bacterium]|nr:hypothetical protein [Anaerolineae bacterium]